MKNIEFWNCIKTLEHINPDGEELFCDRMVKAGLGQTVGGYLDEDLLQKYHMTIDFEKAEPSQNYHFKEYYVDENFVYERWNCKAKDYPTYDWIFCPQLMMYIAEVAGLGRNALLEAYDFVREIEETKGYIGKKKRANYLNGVIPADELERLSYKYKRQFADTINKSTGYEAVLIQLLHMTEINNIIRSSKTYDEIRGRCALL